ncbi:MAG TPA: ERCC4 domain-containing protein [Candidatus Aquilonibacter sp.]|nr:ERCC4 domain-containing protein [Candidatus Aquilonibacter sp.]
MEAPKVIIDNRERNLEIIEGLENNGLTLNFAQLPVGDYILSDRICVERKTSSDLEGSVINGRLFEQLERLRASFEKPMLVIEGNGFKLPSSVILGTALKIYIDYGIPILWSESAMETADILSAISRREQEHKAHEPRIQGLKKAHTEEEWQIHILGSIPGVGMKLAKNLLDHFKSIRNIALADVEELTKIEKIGKKKAQRIYEILNKEYLV